MASRFDPKETSWGQGADIVPTHAAAADSNFALRFGQAQRGQLFRPEYRAYCDGVDKLGEMGVARWSN